MTGEELGNALIASIEALEKRRVKTNFGTAEGLKTVIRHALNPSFEEAEFVPVYPQPVIPPEFPKLLVKWDGKTGAAVEWLIVNDWNEWAPYHGGGWLPWKMEQLGEIKKTAKEHIAEDWERRKAKGA